MLQPVPLREAIDRIFEESFLRPTDWLTRGDRNELGLDVYETKDKLTVKAALPGIKPEDVDGSIDGNVVTIAGEFKTEDELKDKQYHRRELRVGKFERSFALPDRFQTDRAEAVFEHGMLTLAIPKVSQAGPAHQGPAPCRRGREGRDQALSARRATCPPECPMLSYDVG